MYSGNEFKLAVKENVTRSNSNLSYHLLVLALPRVRFVLVRYHLELFAVSKDPSDIILYATLLNVGTECNNVISAVN